jgi:hypothetical protein
MTEKRCVLALAAVACGLLVAGCGDMPGMAGYAGRVVSESGAPVAGAQVIVAPLPAGGIDALETDVLDGKLPDGWHCATDTLGGFLLKGMPTGRYYTPQHENQVDIKAQGAPSVPKPDIKTPGERVIYQQGTWLGLIVTAPGYRPFVASVIFPVPSGTLTVDGGPIRLVGKDLSGVKVEPTGLKFTLVPLSDGGKRPAGAGPNHPQGAASTPGQLQTIEVPLSAVRVSDRRGLPPPG